MFRFEYPDHLYVLAALPVLALLFFLFWQFKKRTLRRLGDLEVLKKMMPGFAFSRQVLKMALLLLALAFLMVAWANPQWGTKREKAKRKGVDVFIALDISQSMLAQDVAPSRLERAKRFSQNLVNGIKGNRVGIILFAGGAYLQMPLTTDYAAAELFLRSANTDLAGTQGTAIGEAIGTALKSFEPNDKFHKALVIISDGENHDESAPEKAAEAAEKGLLVSTVGVGTEGGEFIPMDVGGRPDFKRDESGNPVRTKLDEAMLKSLSEKANGEYFHLSTGDQTIIEALKKRVEKMEKREFEQRSFTEFESYFQYFLAAGLLLLAIEFLLPSGKNHSSSGPSPAQSPMY